MGSRIPPEVPPEDIESQRIDEHLYAGWLTQIVNPTTPDPEIELPVGSRLEGLAAEPEPEAEPVAYGRSRPSDLLAGSPVEAKEAPVSLYRVLLVGTSLTLLVLGALTYQLWIPERRAESYRARMAAAFGELEEFSRRHEELLGARRPPDWRQAADAGRASLAGVVTFRRLVAEEPPRRLPLTVYPGDPDPARLRAEAISLAQALDPLYTEAQSRIALYATLADYADHIRIVDSVLVEDGLEGSDRSVVFKGVLSNLESVRASLVSSGVPSGCEELYGASLNSLEELISAIRPLVAGQSLPTDNSAPAAHDLAPLSTAIARATAALDSPIREALPPSTIENFRRRHDDFAARYVA